jgi:hypothetical protein
LNPRILKWPVSLGAGDAAARDWKLITWTSLVLAVGSGITRSGARLASRVLVAAYLPHGIPLNAGIAALSGLVAVFLVFSCRRVFSLNTGNLGTRSAVLFLGYLAFWALAAEGLRDLLDVDTSGLRKELPPWGWGAIAYFATALWLGARWNPEPTAPSLLSASENDRSGVAYKDEEPPHARGIYIGRQEIIQTLGESGEITAQARYCLATDPGETGREGSGGNPATSWSEPEHRLAHADHNSAPSERVNVDQDTQVELKTLGSSR